MPKPRIINMMVGLPASGKSTLSKTLGANKENTVSFDDALLLTVVTDDYKEAYKKYTESDIVKDIVRRRIDEKLHKLVESDLDFFIDLPNVTVESRADWVNRIRKIDKNSSINAIVAKTPFETILKRNARRKNKFIHVDVLNGMASSFQFPTHEEGFDIVYDIGDSDALINY